MKKYQLKNSRSGLLLIFLILLLITGSCNWSGDPKSQNSNLIASKVDRLKLQPGFKAELIYSPGDNDKGSWVAMTFDDKGRLIASDQYGTLYRLEIPPIGSEGLEPTIEKLRIQTTEPVADSVIQMGFAQGLLWAFNSLYVMVNHRSDDEFDKGSGLYRLQDTDDNGQFDKITLLKALNGSGEHGPHSIILGPDGESLYVIAGNHTDLPEMDEYRLPPVWKEDNLFPQIKDPRGHASDREAPGGWVAKTDPDGKNWVLIGAGFRNAFDIAFNELGDLFTYDADMEWDLGMPWYRPTRICHVTSGSEFGWRTGNGKWSAAYPDNLPPIINIGQGSPTNVTYGKNAKFPDRYRRSLFAFDWSFGIIYSIELKPEGSTYTGVKEEFLSGMPLPLTDGTIGPDGALYFMTGGRRLESDLYRVYYENPEEAIADVLLTETKENKLRKDLEAFHDGPVEGAVDFSWIYLNNEDRFIQYAARIALEHQPVAKWQDRVFAEKDPGILIQGIIALARQTNKANRDKMLNALMKVDYTGISPIQQVDLVRAFELTFYRFGIPGNELKNRVINYLSPNYPAKTDVLNQLLCKMLSFLNDPTVVEKTMAMLESQEGENISVMDNTATDAADLILRNPQYGMDIALTLKNLPPAQHIYYITALSIVTKGWTPELRKKYFEWYYKSFSFKAGRSYVGFVDKARKEALSHVPENQFDHYNQMSGDSLLNKSGLDLSDAALVKGPGRNWDKEEYEPMLAAGMGVRDFDNGRIMFSAAMCSACHTMRGEGGNAGPDLSQLGTRFSPEDMLESIINPSDVISDQYNSLVFSLKNGQSVVGKLVDEDEQNYKISQNPFAPEDIREIPKDQVTGTKFSTVSAMPPGTINRLNEEELKDLLAFLMAGGNPEHEIYSGEQSLP